MKESLPKNLHIWKRKERVLPWNEFIHDSIEAVVQVTAGQLKVHQRFEQVYPAEARTVFNIA